MSPIHAVLCMWPAPGHTSVLPSHFCTACCDDRVQKALDKSGMPEHDLRRLTRRWLLAGATVGFQTHIRAPSCEEAWAGNKVKNSCARHGRVGAGGRGEEVTLTSEFLISSHPRAALLWKVRPSTGAREASAGCSLRNAAVRAQPPVNRCSPVPTSGPPRVAADKPSNVCHSG